MKDSLQPDTNFTAEFDFTSTEVRFGKAEQRSIGLNELVFEFIGVLFKSIVNDCVPGGTQT